MPVKYIEEKHIQESEPDPTGLIQRGCHATNIGEWKYNSMRDHAAITFTEGKSYMMRNRQCSIAFVW
ncbi:hypothetical protein CAJAP_05060 [Camponotus japonicus]